MIRIRSSILIGLVCAAGYAQPVWACATCFGDQDSPQTQGMNMAIFTLLGVTYTLFAGMLCMAFFLWRHNRGAAASAEAEDNHASSAEYSDTEMGHG